MVAPFGVTGMRQTCLDSSPLPSLPVADSRGELVPNPRQCGTGEVFSSQGHLHSLAKTIPDLDNNDSDKLDMIIRDDLTLTEEKRSFVFLMQEL